MAISTCRVLCLDIRDGRGVSREQHGVSLGHFLSRPQDTGSAARTVVAASRATPREAMGWNMVGESRRRVWLAPVCFEPVVAAMASIGGYLSTREGGSWNARKRCRRRCGDGCGLIHSAARDYALEPEPEDGEVECRPNRQNGSGSKPQVSETTFIRLVAVGVCSARQAHREREVQSGASIRFAMEMAMDFFPVRMTDSERAGGEEWSEPKKRGKRVARKR